MENSKNKNSNNNKFVIKDKKRFIAFILIVVVIVIIFFCVTNAKVEIKHTTDITKLDTKKYLNELAEIYSNKKDKFLEDYEKIQGGVGMYIISNTTLDDNSFSILYTDVNTILSSDDWGKIEVDKNTFWKGTWSINQDGILQFKFESKELEPNWIVDEDISGKILQ